MHKEGERLNEMITNFLDMQRLKAKLHENNFKPLELRPLFEEVVAIFASPFAKHSIIVRQLQACRRFRVMPNYSTRHLAIFFPTPLNIPLKGVKSFLMHGWKITTVILWVKDEGRGIPSEALDKIFDMFYRVDDTSRQRIAGTGLGLALVKEIVAAHDGQVWVESS